MISDLIERIKYINGLIQKQQTGTPPELAQKIGVSERTIHRTIELMKSFGAPIEFNIILKSYYYKEEGTFICAFFSDATYSHLEINVDSGKLLPYKVKNICMNQFAIKRSISPQLFI